MNLKADVVVIGAGVVGTTVALELQKAGRSVLLLEKGDVGRGCSLANAGWVTPCFAMPLPQPGMFLKSIGWLLDPTSPLHIQPRLDLNLAKWLIHFLSAMNRPRMLASIAVLTELSQYSLSYYSKLAERNSGLGFDRKGLLMVSATDKGVAAAAEEMRLMAERGIPGRLLGRDEVLAFEPTLRPIVKGGVYFSDEAQLEPYPTSLAILREFEALGGKTLSQQEVYDFEVFEGEASRIRKIKTTQGVIEPETVVLATGSWSPEVAKKLRIGIPVLGGKGYSMTFQGISKKPTRSIMIVDRKIAVTPFSDRLRVAGTLELVNQDFSISTERLEAVRRGAHEYLDLGGGENHPPVDIWRGLRPCTPDGVPVVGFSRRVSNLFYCTGHQMLGLQSAPGTAHLAADLLLGRTPLVDPKPFRADRFGS